MTGAAPPHRANRLLPAFTLLLAACVRPVGLTDDRMLSDLAARYADFHSPAGDPEARKDAELLRPRLGLPAIVRAGDGFAIEWLERGGPSPVQVALAPHDVDGAAADRCPARGAPLLAHAGVERSAGGRPPLLEGCAPLALDDVVRVPVGEGITRVSATARTATPLPPGSYDLHFDSGSDAVFRAPRAVWLRDHDPAAPRALRVALLSDLHIGKSAFHLDEHLRVVLDEINRLAPDLVVLTGDVSNLGQNAAQEAKASRILERIAAPMLVVIGNHDHGFGLSPNLRQTYGSGYFNFARAFHPMLYYEMTVGGWQWVGFDSGPSVLGPTVNNRGVAPETLGRIGAALDEARDSGKRGVVLFSHCATRAAISDKRVLSSIGLFGRMQRGGRELERRELAAAAGGQRVLHLAGHTHWSDLFEAKQHRGRLRYELNPGAPIEPGPHRVASRAAIVTVQSATHPGVARRSGRGFGYALLTLDDGDPQLEYVRHFDRTPRSPFSNPFTGDPAR